jgi:hypothetical protein
MKDKLFILWTNDNPITSEKMVCMYAHNSVLERWWDEVTVIIWGATAKYVANDQNIQNRLKQMMKDGVKISACKACADQLGVGSHLENIGIEVKYWGEPLTEILKKNQKLITI